MHNVTTDPSALENITRAVRAYVDEHRRAKLQHDERERESELHSVPSEPPVSR